MDDALIGRFAHSDADGALRAFSRDGVIVIDDVIDRSVLLACQREMNSRYPEYFQDLADDDRFYVSDRRFYRSIKIDGPVADPQLIANPLLRPIVEGILGPDFILDSFGVIVALPGAGEQPWHRDGGILFPGHPLERMLPPSAITLVMPLVAMDSVHGSTGFAPGSHRNDELSVETPCAPEVPIGSCAIWDYRIFHKGMANCSSEARPVLFAVYCHPWWVDVGNFNGGQGEKMHTSAEAFEAFEPAIRKILIRARIEG